MSIGILSSILHEFGHILAMLIKNHQISSINIGFFKVDILDKNRNLVPYNDDIFILASGSVANLTVSMFCFIIFCLFRIYLAKQIAYINFFIGMLNILPISSLDGGQILSIFVQKSFSPEFSDILCLAVSFLFLFPLSMVGFLVLLKSKYNFSLFFICFCLVSTLILKNES